MAETFYLRPSSDISIHENVNGRVEGSEITILEENIYTTISEEVCDENTTTLAHGIGDSTAESKFVLNGQFPNASFKVTGAKSCVMAQVWCPKTGTGYAEFEMIFTTEDGYAESTGAVVYEITDATEMPFKAFYADLPNLANHVAAFVKQNGRMPAINVTIRTTNVKTGSGGTTCNYISQVYLEFTYSTGLNLYHKEGGTWKQAQAAYQKKNGAWVEITEDECKAVLQSGLVLKQ